MTADKLRAIVLRMANAIHVRYWLHWNYPVREPWMMAVGFDRCHNRPAVAAELRKHGFADAGDVFTVERTGEDGSPFQCGL